MGYDSNGYNANGLQGTVRACSALAKPNVGATANYVFGFEYGVAREYFGSTDPKGPGGRDTATSATVVSGEAGDRPTVRWWPIDSTHEFKLWSDAGVKPFEYWGKNCFGADYGSGSATVQESGWVEGAPKVVLYTTSCQVDASEDAILALQTFMVACDDPAATVTVMNGATTLLNEGVYSNNDNVTLGLACADLGTKTLEVTATNAAGSTTLTVAIAVVDNEAICPA